MVIHFPFYPFHISYCVDWGLFFLAQKIPKHLYISIPKYNIETQKEIQKMIQKTQIPGKDFETEIEQHLNNGAMAYEGHTIAAVPFTSKEEQIEFIKNECIVFEDTENYYIAKDDGTGDYEVQVCKKTKYEHLA